MSGRRLAVGMLAAVLLFWAMANVSAQRLRIRSITTVTSPSLSSVSPNSGTQGNTVSVTLTGTNFVIGATTISVSGSNVTVSGTSVSSTTSATANFVIGSSATTGARSVTVTTVDGTSGAQTFTVNASGGGGGGSCDGVTDSNWTLVSTNTAINSTNSYAWMEFDPSDATGNTLWTVVRKVGPYKSTDRGATWTLKNTGVTTPTTNDPLSIAISTDGQHMVLATRSTGIFVSNNGGDNWARPTSGLASALDVAGVNWYSATNEFIISANTGGATAAWASSDNLNYTQVSSTITTGLVARMQCFSAASQCWLGSESNGVFLSTDAGRTWTQSNASFGGAFRFYRFQSNTYAIIEASHPYRYDGGSTWTDACVSGGGNCPSTQSRPADGAATSSHMYMQTYHTNSWCSTCGGAHTADAAVWSTPSASTVWTTFHESAPIYDTCWGTFNHSSHGTNYQTGVTPCPHESRGVALRIDHDEAFALMETSGELYKACVLD